MRWKQTGPDTWGLFDRSEFAGMPVEMRVAIVKERTMGLTTRRYEAFISGANPMLVKKSNNTVTLNTMVFANLEDAQTWAQTTYRLTK